MLIQTIDEQVGAALVKYMFETGNQDTCMRIMMDVMQIVGEGKNLMVTFDEVSNELTVSYDISENNRKVFTICDSTVFEEENF